MRIWEELIYFFFSNIEISVIIYIEEMWLMEEKYIFNIASLNIYMTCHRDLIPLNFYYQNFIIFYYILSNLEHESIKNYLLVIHFFMNYQ